MKTKRGCYHFLMYGGFILVIGNYNINVSAQEIGKTQFLISFSKYEKQEIPDYFPSSMPESIPSDMENLAFVLPQLNQRYRSWIMYSGLVCIYLVVFYLTSKKIDVYYKEVF